MPRALLPAAVLLVCAVAVAALLQQHSNSRPPGGTGEAGGAVEPGAPAGGAPAATLRSIPRLPAGPEADRRLAVALAALDRRTPAASCLLVSEGERVLFERRPDRPLVPASVTKILTAAAVLAAGDDIPGTRDLVTRMLRESDNDAAAELLSRIGGERAVGLLRSAGVPVEGVRIVDGSGLDRGNRATCRAIHAVLARAPSGGAIDDGLAVAGRSGTLASRFRDADSAGRLRAKTGSIRDVAALAGFVDSIDGPTLTFVQILNDVSPELGASLQDELAALLENHPDPAAVDGVDPGSGP